MNVPTWVWLATVAGIVGLLVFDFYAHVRTPHEPTFRESAWWSTFYIALALLFGAGLLVVAGAGHGGEYFAGYVTEKSLSVDNLFVFLILITRFGVPRPYQQKVLLVGVAIALVLRGLFIWAGAAMIAQFSWVFYLFGLFLVYTAIKLAREEHQEQAPAEFHENRVLRLVRRVLPATDGYRGDRLTVVEAGRRLVTPMLIVMIAIGTTDLLFALDSIPAIFGLTREPYIVFTANAFALLGLRQLYFLIGGLLQRLVFLAQGLAFILAFIGVKLVLEALHTNQVWFINGGEHVGWAPEVPIWLSLSVILGTLAVATVASLVVTARGRRDVASRTQEQAVEQQAGVPVDRQPDGR
ncbi:TerC family protein [Cellulomonas bogoriensis]|uniref:Tellurium resistance protein TerC n=1 Tax=Cellulomonas bogoriensis 69B4 = DSM 16987 TaxID=1386082 RepID=A0A0A0C373_9CELL|nr:TerC family protein [Cellulomonas bogoriensis]KGM14477.1 tellurium resistance protein TerC [Cellulomonas bogoriensis 69B4 = DSM 16987]